MTITLKYFASLREHLSCEQEVLELPAKGFTAASLRNHLISRGEPFSSALAPSRSIRVAVNYNVVTPEFEIPDQAEVAFFPPVTGG
jgi:molybdopterin synthase sulfur carrier subunit